MVRLALSVVLLAAGCATARPALRPPEVAPDLPAVDVAGLVGWGPDHPSTLARATWTPAEGGAPVEAAVLERHAGAERELVLALVRRGELLGALPLGRLGPHRSVGASLAELPLGRGGDRALRVDVRAFESGDGQRFAVKSTLVGLLGARPLRLLDRLVESGDRLRDRRAAVSVEERDGAVDLVVEERESGPAPPRRLVYHRGADGRFVTADRSIFEE
jgi:hypothetical protein